VAKLKQHIQEQLKKLYPGVQFPKHDFTNEPEVLTTRNKVSKYSTRKVPRHLADGNERMA
jgi:hypothetical protein